MVKRRRNMDSTIFNPQEEFETKYRDLHLENTKAFFNDLVEKSGVDIELNRETVRKYNEYKNNLEKLKKSLFWWRFLRVLMCITLILIPLVVIKVTPKIRGMREEIANAEQTAERLLQDAYDQMAPLNALFTDRDALNIIEKTIPRISFDTKLSPEQETDMKINYDFFDEDEYEQSTLGVLAGKYNENPFLFENRFVHTMGTETYHGELTITWTETYVSNGKVYTRTRRETLHASVEKPKPYYSTQVVLNYCTQGGPELIFTRSAAHHERMSDKETEKFVKKFEKQLKKMENKALKNGGDFTALANTEFEALFDATDRNNELQYRTLFTPLAQTNMVKLMRKTTGYGDDFSFFKINRTNVIVTEHSQGRVLNVMPEAYYSYNYDEINDSFTNKNITFFKDVYFDFAPVWAIPMYQDRPVHSLKPIPSMERYYSRKESEALTNLVDYSYVVHPNTKTDAIVKSAFVASHDKVDETLVTAYSYDIYDRVDYVQVYGGDGHYHSVPVPWKEYIPLQQQTTLFVSDAETAQEKNVIATRNGMCIFN